MPQLNTSPWLMVFLAVWLTLMLYSIKNIKTQEPLKPALKPVKTPHAHWQWH